MSTTNEEELYQGTAPKTTRMAPTTELGDSPDVIIPKIMTDPKLTPEERQAFLLRYLRARDERNKHVLNAQVAEIQNAMAFAGRQDATMRSAFGGMPPQPGGYGSPYAAQFPAYPLGYPSYMPAQQPSPWSAQELTDTILSPITSTLSLIQVLIRGAIVIFSWTAVFYIFRFFYGIIF
jgi:hypothetical protein